ncbi:hypothetical protein [Bifidobacterium porcinum]|nr:hypothetical protein [Bifidobacterium porcinum]
MTLSARSMHENITAEEQPSAMLVTIGITISLSAATLGTHTATAAE